MILFDGGKTVCRVIHFQRMMRVLKGVTASSLCPWFITHTFTTLKIVGSSHCHSVAENDETGLVLFRISVADGPRKPSERPVQPSGQTTAKIRVQRVY
jgi:hypothetical protein